MLRKQCKGLARALGGLLKGLFVAAKPLSMQNRRSVVLFFFHDDVRVFPYAFLGFPSSVSNWFKSLVEVP